MSHKSSSAVAGPKDTPRFERPTAEQSQTMDNTIDRFKDSTPARPYIMSVFSDPPYQHTHRTRHNWLSHTPFDRDEDDHMQYQTLLWRDPLETLFCLESTENMEARRVGVSQASSAPGSRAGTPLPSSGVAKKKISLAAYKNKKQTGTLAQASDVNDGGSQEEMRPTPEIKAEDQSDAAPSPALQGKKRSAEHVMKKESVHDSIDFSLDAMDDILPSPKKRRLSNSAKGEQKTIKPAAALRPESSMKTALASEPKTDPRTAAKALAVTISEDADPVFASDPMFLSANFPVDSSKQSPFSDDLPRWFAPKEDSSPNSLINNNPTVPSPNGNGILPLGGNPGITAKRKRSPTPDVKPTDKPLPLPSGSLAKSNAPKPDGAISAETVIKGEHNKDAKKLDSKPKPQAKSLESTYDIKLSESSSNEHRPSTPSNSQVASKRLPQAQSSSATERPSNPTTNASRPAMKHVKNKSSGSFFDNLKSSSISASPKLVPSIGHTSHPSLVLKLKYGRQRRKQVERILHMKAVPKKQTNSYPSTHSDADKDRGPPENTTDSSVGKSEPSQKDGGNLTKGGKRPLPDDSNTNEPSAKRPRGSIIDENKSPRTPNLGTIRSPAALTPASTHTKDVKTGLLAAPSATSKGTSPPTSIKTSPGADDSISSDSWKSENSRLRILGRSVKKSSTELFEAAEKEKDNKKGTRLKKRAAVLGVESVLCFMQAFSASDEYTSRKESLSHWKSILPYASQVSGRCKEYSHLYGMSTLLRTAVSSRILALYGRMKSKELEDFEDKLDPFALVSQEIEASRQLALASERNLPQSTMATDYPRTQGEANKIPVGMITRPVLAARMGIVFLNEWTTQQKIEWTKQLEEGLCCHL